MSKFPKIYSFNTEARAKLLEGMRIVHDAVVTTLGPLGQNVAINTAETPVVLHDGVSVAKSVDLHDEFQDMGAQLLKASAIKTNDQAGDGTTTATAIAYAIAVLGDDAIKEGKNPMVLKQEIQEASKEAIKHLKKLSKKVNSKREIEFVATISAANKDTGKIVADAVHAVGKTGIVNVEKYPGIQTVIEHKRGLEFDRGYLSANFVTDAARAEAVIEEPFILLTDKKINYNNEIAPFFEKFLKTSGSKNIVIIASEVVDEAMATLVINNTRGVIKAVAIQAPSYGLRRVEELEDLAAAVGGVAITADSGRSLESVDIAELGRAERVIVGRDYTQIIGGKGTTLPARVEELKEQVRLANNKFDEDLRRARLARLTGGAAVIKVGGQTDIEANETKERVIDAVNAAKAAIEEGVVAGGGAILEEISKNITLTTQGAEIFKKALKRPLQILRSNAGITAEEMAYPTGIDVTDGQVKDLIKAGIIDPAKVTRCAIENAVSVSTMVLTTNVLLTEKYTND